LQLFAKALREKKLKLAVLVSKSRNDVVQTDAMIIYLKLRWQQGLVNFNN